MARSRNIKPGFFLNEELAEISPEGRLLFIGLWCLADREGRLEDRPKKIKAEIFPYENYDVENFIKRYGVAEKRYLQVTNFTRHQNPHPKEAKSTIPAYEEIPETLENTERREKDKPSREKVRSSREKVKPSREKERTSRADSLQSDSLQSDSLNQKISYAENVKMTEEQYAKLKERLNGSEAAVNKCIEILDNYKGSKGAKYKDDYRAILSWVLDKYMKEYGRASPSQIGFINIHQEESFGTEAAT